MNKYRKTVDKIIFYVNKLPKTYKTIKCYEYIYPLKKLRLNLKSTCEYVDKYVDN